MFLPSRWLYRGRVDDVEALEAIGALADEVRRGLYRFVRRQERPVTRAEAARALRISIKLASFHLDKLVERGLLYADSEAPRGIHRRVGRAPKWYRPSDLQVSLSLPERRYDLLGEILVDALTQADPQEPSTDTATKVAHEHGERLGARTREARRLGRPGPERTLAVAEELLDRHGFEPATDHVGGLVLRNCPFSVLARRAPELVCSLNAAFIDGLLRGMGNTTVAAELAPQEGLCCVRLTPPAPKATIE